MRESNDSVFVIFKGLDHPIEQLLMYYSVSKGDVYSTDFFTGLVVDSVATKSIAGKNRKVIYIDQMNIIEGIGIDGSWYTNSSSGLFSGIMHLSINVSGMDLGPLKCFGADGVINESYRSRFSISETCVPAYSDFVGGAEVSFEHLKIFQSHKDLVIENDQTLVKDIRVYSLQGKLLYKQQSTTHTRFKNVFLGVGVYVVSVRVDNSFVSSKVIVSE